MFLYSTVSTLKPIVGMVVTTSPNFSLYRIVVWEEIGASEGRGLALEKTGGVNFSEKRN